MKREYLAILKQGAKRPSLMTTEDHSKIWWGEGPSYCYWESGDQIIKSYGVHDDKMPEKTDEIFLRFERDFPPETGIRNSCGWLSPDGTYYPCGEMEHQRVAQTIVAIQWNDFGDSRDLVRKGWVQVSDGYIQHDWPYTQKQLDTLFDISQIASGRLKETIELHLEITKENNDVS